MTSEAQPATSSPRRRAPGWLWDLPLLVLLVVCWMTIPLAAAHIVTGLALAAWAVAHLLTRPGRYLRVAGSGVRPRVAAWRSGHLLLILVALAMTVSGVLRWAGIPREYAGHAIASYTLVLFALVHLVLVRRSLRVRLQTRSART